MTLETFAENYRLHTRRDECNEIIIPGRRGQIYQWSEDGKIFGVMFMPAITKANPWGRWAPKKWGNARRAGIAIGMTVLQNGDSEGCLAFDPENEAQVSLALKIARIKTKRHASPTQLANLKHGMGK